MHFGYLSHFVKCSFNLNPLLCLVHLIIIIFFSLVFDRLKGVMQPRLPCKKTCLHWNAWPLVAVKSIQDGCFVYIVKYFIWNKNDHEMSSLNIMDFRTTSDNIVSKWWQCTVSYCKWNQSAMLSITSKQNWKIWGIFL